MISKKSSAVFSGYHHPSKSASHPVSHSACTDPSERVGVCESFRTEYHTDSRLSIVRCPRHPQTLRHLNVPCLGFHTVSSHALECSTYTEFYDLPGWKSPSGIFSGCLPYFTRKTSLHFAATPARSIFSSYFVRIANSWKNA